MKSSPFRILTQGAIVLTGLLLGFPGHANPPECGSDQVPTEAARGELVFNSGDRFPISMILRPGGPRAVSQYYPGGTKYLRILLRGTDELTTSKWRLSIRDEEYRNIQVLGPADFENSRTIWTTRIPGNTAFLVLESEDRSLRIRVAEYVAMPGELENTYYSVLDPTNPRYVDLFPESGSGGSETYADKALGDSVGMLLTSYGEQAWTCSGVVVSDDLFLSNWHCGAPRQLMEADAWLPEICASATIDLSWDNDSMSRDYQCVEVLEKDKALDFVLLRIQPLRDAGLPKPVSIDVRQKEFPDAIRIIHHPLGKTKQISSDCNVSSLTYQSPMGAPGNQNDFLHNCDTSQGSSGAPVFDSSGALIGLHHLGFMLNASGSSCDNANKAVWMRNIIRHLGNQDPGYLNGMDIIR